MNARVTWTVTVAGAANPEATIFRAVTYDVTGTRVTAPRAGNLLYRICLSNTTAAPVSFLHVFVQPQAATATAQTGIGPTTAVLGGGGTVCGELIPRSGHLSASSNVPVTWFVRAFDGNLDVLRQVKPLTVTATSVDQVIGPGPYAYLDVCAINHANAATLATLSMELSPVAV